MSVLHVPGVRPVASVTDLGRGADGVVVELLDHPELVLKDMNHRFELGRNRVALELRLLAAVIEATDGRGATRAFDFGTDESKLSWLVRERVFDDFPRGSQADRHRLVDLILRIHPTADVSRIMLPDPTFDDVRWGHALDDPEPRWILIDP